MGHTQLGPVTHLSPSDVASLWVEAGGDASKADVAVGIVFAAESPTGNAGIVNDTPETGDYSVGLWQINYYADLLATRSALFGSPAELAADPLRQAKAAVAMSQNGTNWQAWAPDLGYRDYSRAVSDPLPGSKVANWLASHSVPSPGMPASHLVALGIGVAVFSGAVAWAISEGVFDGILARVPVPRFGQARENPTRRLRPEALDLIADIEREARQARREGRDEYADGLERYIEKIRAGKVRVERGRARERELPPMYVQSLLFPLDRYNVPEAKRWAKHHGYRTSPVDVTDKYIHIVQVDPGTLRVIRTVPFGHGIKAHVGREAA